MFFFFQVNSNGRGFEDIHEQLSSWEFATKSASFIEHSKRDNDAHFVLRYVSTLQIYLTIL